MSGAQNIRQGLDPPIRAKKLKTGRDEGGVQSLETDQPDGLNGIQLGGGGKWGGTVNKWKTVARQNAPGPKKSKLPKETENIRGNSTILLSSNPETRPSPILRPKATRTAKKELQRGSQQESLIEKESTRARRV